MAKISFCMKNVYRAKWCAAHHMEPLAKLFMQINSVLFGCHISYRAEIPKTTSISHHGHGVVINGACKFGENVIIGHGVTIGNRMPLHPGHPVIGNNVYIGSGAYLGGGCFDRRQRPYRGPRRCNKRRSKGLYGSRESR